MSAIAGRVLLIPKGNYDSTATYTMLDMVVYNGSSYICKQECTGVVPTNTTYWMLNASGSAVAFLNDIGDVVITNPTNEQVLMYNSTTQKWVNGTLTLNKVSDIQFASLSNGQVLKYNATSQKWENADEAGGILPHLIVISETGSTVTATKGQTVITATETSTGHFECDLTEFGTWTIDAILGGDDAQVSLVVDTVKVYTVDDSHFHATVTVKYPSGATCRLQSADETLYATGSPYTFTVHHAETYTITVTYNQRIYTDTVTFTTEGQSFSKTLPSPSEIDVINDIDTWLWYGDVSGTFSTLEEILANSTALSILMASTDAVDYLVRCKDWITKEALIPIMTSDTTPSGEAFASGYEGTSDLPYKAFDGNDTTRWSVWGTSVLGAYIGYKFTTPKKVNRIIGINSTTGTVLTCEFKVQGSNDGTTWTDIDTITWADLKTEQNFVIQNNNEYLYYRLYCNSANGMVVDSSGTTHSCMFYALQFYSEDGVTDNQSAMSYIGLNNYCADTLLADEDWCEGICNSTYFESVLTVKVPTMTSDTTPSGVASASSNYSGRNPWYAFDNNATTYWTVASQGVAWLQYEFTSTVNVARVDLKTYGNGSDFTLQYSDDGVTFEDTDISVANITSTNLISYIGNTTYGEHKYWRLNFTNSKNHQIYTAQFYGREDV